MPASASRSGPSEASREGPFFFTLLDRRWRAGRVAFRREGGGRSFSKGAEDGGGRPGKAQRATAFPGGREACAGAGKPVPFGYLSPSRVALGRKVLTAGHGCGRRVYDRDVQVPWRDPVWPAWPKPPVGFLPGEGRTAWRSSAARPGPRVVGQRGHVQGPAAGLATARQGRAGRMVKGRSRKGVKPGPGAVGCAAKLVNGPARGARG